VKWKGLFVLGSVLSLFNLARYLLDVTVSRRNALTRPPDTVSVIMPALLEDPKMVRRAIESLRSNLVVVEYPDYFEFIGVSGQDDFSFSLSGDMFDKIVEAPPGKLRARHTGIESSSGNIIVAVDADSYYPEYWLGAVLAPFHDPGVVAVSGVRIVFPLFTPFDYIFRVGYYSRCVLTGSGSAFRRDAYYRVGGFNLDVKSWNELWLEEEYLFKRRLEKIGKVVLSNAPFFTFPRPNTAMRIGEDLIFEKK